MTYTKGPFTDARRRSGPALFALAVLATPALAALIPPGPREPQYLVLAITLSAAIALAVMLCPWQRLPAWAQAAPPLAYFAVVVLAEMAAAEKHPSVLALMLLPVLWLAANGTRSQVLVSLAGLATMGTVGVLTTEATSSDWRRASVSFLVAGLISLGVQRAVESSRRSEARYRTLAEHLPDMGVVTFDRDLRYDLRAGEHEAMTRLVGGEELEDLYGRALAGEEISIEHSADRDLWLRAVPLRDDRGAVQGGMVVSQDVTERNRAEAAARAAEELFRRAFEDGAVGMAIVSLDGHYLRVNRALCQIVGREEDELRGRSVDEIVHPEDYAAGSRRMKQLLEGEGEPFRGTTRSLLPDGGVVWTDVGCSLIRDDQDRPLYFVAQIEDVTARHDAEQELQHLANHDALTGLINRRRFEENLERELLAAKRYGRQGAVLVLDLDNFKYVNDTLGHSAGDELITTVSALLRRRLRESDTLSRIGGDEFAVILPDCTPRQAEAAAEGLLCAIREGLLEHHRGGRSSASIGVAPYGHPYEQSGEELLVEADVAMYEAKERGRDRVEVFEHDVGTPSPLQGRLTWARRIEQALTEERFELHAQPILSLRDDPIPRHELLVRMRGEDGDLIPPAAFLGVAERFELIQSIDRWVVSRAIELLAGRQQAGEPVSLEVNLSAKSVTDPELPGFIEDRLEAAEVDPSGLIFEVTETAAIVNVDRARLFADRLGELGCGFALDDFGAGFASFYYLKHLDFDLLKIDGEFIRGLPESRTNQLVVRSLVDLAQGLGKHTVAEFVGDEETLDLLRNAGVDYAQGFHVGLPVPVAEAGLLIPEGVSS